MTSRYFADPPIKVGAITLGGSEAHHMIHVMRACPGADVMLFDGSGAEFLARVSRIDRTSVELKVIARTETDRELSTDVTLAVTLPKGDRQKWLVEKAVELGVRRIIPLATARSVAKPGQKAVDRLRRTVIEASKQCGRNVLLELSKPLSWPELLQTQCDAPCRVLAHPSSAEADRQPQALTIGGLPRNPLDRLVLAIGPEGGFTPDEVTAARSAGWTTIDLGPRILRIETAAIVLTAMMTQLAASAVLPAPVPPA